MSISSGNSKLGNIPNISLPPIKACENCAHCKSDCYALKAYRMYPSVRKSWDENLSYYNDSPLMYFVQIRAYLTDKKPSLFRWHVSGDILNQYYLNNMVSIAITFPDIKFLAFTKMFKLNYSKCPDNLSIVFSCWVGMTKPRQKKGVAGFYWLQDGKEKRIPKKAIECFGSCENCGMCFNIAKLEVNHIWNRKH